MIENALLPASLSIPKNGAKKERNPVCRSTKETTLERAVFKAGWSELSCLDVLSLSLLKSAWTTADKKWKERK